MLYAILLDDGDWVAYDDSGRLDSNSNYIFATASLELALKNVVHVEGRVVPLYTPEEVETRERAAFRAGFNANHTYDREQNYLAWREEQRKSNFIR